MENKEEIWKETEFPGYFVSNLGNLLGRSGKPVKQQVNEKGYYVYAMYPNGRKGGCKCVKIHKLVAKAFIPNPENKPQVNHIDGNKLNNNVENLEWCTNQENVIHAYKTGLAKARKGADNPNSKLTKEDAKWIREHYKPNDEVFGARPLSRKFGVAHSQIVRIAQKKKYNDE